jgi:hypothetical protein
VCKAFDRSRLAGQIVILTRLGLAAAGAVSRAKPAIPDSTEVVDIFCQAQLAKYSRYGLRQAELDASLVGLVTVLFKTVAIASNWPALCAKWSFLWGILLWLPVVLPLMLVYTFDVAPSRLYLLITSNSS